MWQCGNVSTRGDACRERAAASSGCPLVYTPSCQLRLKARVDLGDQTAEFILFGVISTAILTYFYRLLGTNVRISVSVINTRFQPDAPGWCTIGRWVPP